MTVMRLRSLSKGSSCTNSCEGAIDSRAIPPFADTVSSAPSVGSPIVFQRPVSGSRSSVALLQSAAVCSMYASGAGMSAISLSSSLWKWPRGS